MTTPQGQVDVTKLTAEQLVQLYKQIELEMEALQKAAPVITASISACNDSIESINQLKMQHPGGEVLLPVSESAYAYGEIVETQNVLVGIGGGYMAELPSDKAVKMYESRIQNRKGELIKIRQALGTHQLTKDQIELELRSRQATQQPPGDKK